MIPAEVSQAPIGVKMEVYYEKINEYFKGFSMCSSNRQ